MKRFYLSILFSSLIVLAYCQSTPDMLENSLGAIVTVGVYKTDIAKRSLGFRGETAPDLAYEKALDLAEVSGSGSGFIIEENGKLYVITNAHVVEDASDEPESIYVYSVNRNKYEVKLIGGDSFYDVAVLEFLDIPGSEISTVRFRETDIRIGEKVYAIGNPLGEYPYTVTDGIVSAKNRMRGGMTGKFGFLQTTATIIWGNSGGPLLDVDGKVAGINSQIAFAETPGGDHILQSQINFALEADISKRLVNDIITNDGRVKRAFLGVEISQKYGYEYDGSYGYIPYEIDSYPVISGLIPGSSASESLADNIGWQIKKINGKEIRNLEEVLGELEKVKPGNSVIFSLEMYGTTSEVPVSTGELTSTELGQIARYVMSQNEDIVVDYDHPQVTFKMKESNFYYHSEKELYKNEKELYKSEKELQKYQMTGESLQDSYYILAAGISSEDATSMWLIEDIKDMGAAFRLTGSSGLIDFYVLKAGNSVDDIELLRQYLSGNEDVTKSSLWY